MPACLTGPSTFKLYQAWSSYPKQYGCGSKFKSQGYAGVGLCFHLPRGIFWVHFFEPQPYLFYLSPSAKGLRKNPPEPSVPNHTRDRGEREERVANHYQAHTAWQNYLRQPANGSFSK